MSRPIVLPELPRVSGLLQGDNARDLRAWNEAAMLAYARAAVEADRKGIVVTDEDVQAAWDAYNESDPVLSTDDDMRAALESFAKRLRGETP